MVKKNITTANFVKASILDYRNILESLDIQNKLNKQTDHRIAFANEAIIERQIDLNNKILARSNYSTRIKDQLLAEAINNIYLESFDEYETSSDNLAIRRHLVSQFVEQVDTSSLLLHSKRKSTFLSEMSNLITKYHKIIMEGFDKKIDTDLSGIDKDTVDNFFDELRDSEVEEIKSEIQSRVAAAIEDFVSQHRTQKEEIKTILTNSKEKLDGLSNDQQEVAENTNRLAKLKIQTIRNRPTNLFSELVARMAESALKNEKIKNELANKDGSLNMDLIVERVTNLYTLIETLNTIKLINVDEAYVSDLIASFRS